MKVVIIGGVAGGASTAARLRRNDEKAEIIIFEKGKYISFANCGLPYYIGGIITDRNDLLVQTPEKMKERFNIDIRVESEVTEIDRKNKKVKIKDHSGKKTYEESYDKLVISTGSTPLKPSIPGIDSEGIFTIWNIPDTDAISSYMEEKSISRAVVVGGGFIGIEMAENLRHKGVEVCIVEMLDQVLAPLDFEMAQIVHQHINMKDVELFLNNGVKSFEKKDEEISVFLADGKEIKTDMVILSIGIRPNSEIAAGAGLPLNKKGGIIVDEYMKTQDENIYAVGDVVQVKDFVTGQDTMIPLAGPANKQGRIAADNICGKKVKYNGTQGTSVAKVFDLTVSTTGNNEKALKKAGMKYGEDYIAVYVHPNNHAGYYPGASSINMKMVFNPKTGKILGAQALGFEGVEKRIDVISAAMRMQGTVTDLAELELAYAPPFGSAKDPVNMLGFTAENIMTGMVESITWQELDDYAIKGRVVLDVRSHAEFDTGNYPGSVNIPVDEIRERLNDIDKNKNILIYCKVGIRGYIASRILMQNGYENVKNISGGYVTYSGIKYNINSMMPHNLITGAREKRKNDSQEAGEQKVNSMDTKKIVLNCTGLQCPGPILEVFKSMKEMRHGDLLEVTASDMGFAEDISQWCERTGNTLLNIESYQSGFRVVLMKGRTGTVEKPRFEEKTDKAMVVFNGELDKIIAAFIIANGAVSMGRKVTMFFTFWGLNALRKNEKVKVKKSFVENMFGIMMPRGTDRLKLSNMNMAGMGSAMMKKIMKDKNVETLENLMTEAKNNGVKIVACTMSMDVMGIKKEELIEGIDFGGVASFLAASEKSGATLFI